MKGSSTQSTSEHKENVNNLIVKLVIALLERAQQHDISKLEDPELELFDIYTPKLAKSTYGSEEYKQFLQELKPALDHHYKVNRHHPEHFENGCKDMNLIDILEMLVDWKAATLRHIDGDIHKSLEINKERFQLESITLYDILRNSLEIFEN